jgi:hypothetical protein
LPKHEDNHFTVANLLAKGHISRSKHHSKLFVDLFFALYPKPTWIATALQITEKPLYAKELTVGKH